MNNHENAVETSSRLDMKELRKLFLSLREILLKKKNLKIISVIAFILGIPLSYPTLLPFGVICSSILFLQENKKANFAGFSLIMIQIISLWIIISSYYVTPF